MNSNGISENEFEIMVNKKMNNFLNQIKYKNDKKKYIQKVLRFFTKLKEKIDKENKEEIWIYPELEIIDDVFYFSLEEHKIHFGFFFFVMAFINDEEFHTEINIIIDNDKLSYNCNFDKNPPEQLINDFAYFLQLKKEYNNFKKYLNDFKKERFD